MSIQIQLPDGSRREVPSGTTPFEIANSISPRLAAAVVVAKIQPLASRTSTATTDTAQTDAALSEEAMYAADDAAAELSATPPHM